MNKNGFAIILTLLFVLFLTLFGFSLLLLAGSYYSSTRNLFEKQSARLACDQSLQRLIDRHNLESGGPRLFFDPSIWNGTHMVPFLWNQHEMNATLDAIWNSSAINRIHVSSRRGPFSANLFAELRQRRIEDFALYIDSKQELNSAAFFDGPVYGKQGLVLNTAGSVFLDVVQAELSGNEPDLRKPNLQQLPYPAITELLDLAGLEQRATTSGLKIVNRNIHFWNGSSYELDFDKLQIEPQGKRWNITYNGTRLGTIRELIFWFDDTVTAVQRSLPPVFNSIRTPAPLYVATAADLHFATGLHTLESRQNRHPLALVAMDAAYINSKEAVLLDAFVAVRGSDLLGENEYGVFVEAGSDSLTAEESNYLRGRILTSPVLLEEDLKASELEALSGAKRLVWFAGGLALQAPIHVADEKTHMHFQRSHETYPVIPPLPFVAMVAGSKSWE